MDFFRSFCAQNFYKLGQTNIQSQKTDSDIRNMIFTKTRPKMTQNWFQKMIFNFGTVLSFELR